MHRHCSRVLLTVDAVFCCRFPTTGMPARVTQQIIRDKRLLDANPRCQPDL